MTNVWDNPEISDQLKVLVSQSCSYANIGAQLSSQFNVEISRNSAIGRARRLGLETVHINKPPKPRREKLIRIKREKAKPVGSRPVYNVVKNGGGGFRIQESRTSDMPNLRCVEVEPLHVTLLDREVGACRYPYGGDTEGEAITFCGHPALTDKPYCGKHAALCYTEPKPRKQAVYVTRKV